MRRSPVASTGCTLHCGKIRQVNSPKASKKTESDDPRIDLAEARAAAALSDYRRSQAAASRAADAAVRQGARLERGQALLQQCFAFRRLGQFEDAKGAGQQAQGIFADSRYGAWAARSLTCMANVLEDQGDLANAQQMHEKALSLAQSIDARIDIAGALNNLERCSANGACWRNPILNIRSGFGCA